MFIYIYVCGFPSKMWVHHLQNSNNTLSVWWNGVVKWNENYSDEDVSAECYWVFTGGLSVWGPLKDWGGAPGPPARTPPAGRPFSCWLSPAFKSGTGSSHWNIYKHVIILYLWVGNRSDGPLQWIGIPLSYV